MNLRELGFGNLSRIWLDTILLENFGIQTDSFFGPVRRTRKAGQAVLPVFFGKAGTCIVTQEAFDTMVELNPQLGRELRPLLLSPEFPLPVISIREDVIEEYGTVIEESLRSLHTDAAGKQLLSLFHIDKLVPYEPRFLKNILELLARHETLLGSEGIN